MNKTSLLRVFPCLRARCATPTALWRQVIPVALHFRDLKTGKRETISRISLIGNGPYQKEEVTISTEGKDFSGFGGTIYDRGNRRSTPRGLRRHPNFAGHLHCSVE